MHVGLLVHPSQPGLRHLIPSWHSDLHQEDQCSSVGWIHCRAICNPSADFHLWSNPSRNWSTFHCCKYVLIELQYGAVWCIFYFGRQPSQMFPHSLDLLWASNSAKEQQRPPHQNRFWWGGRCCSFSQLWIVNIYSASLCCRLAVPYSSRLTSIGAVYVVPSIRGSLKWRTHTTPTTKMSCRTSGRSRAVLCLALFSWDHMITWLARSVVRCISFAPDRSASVVTLPNRNWSILVTTWVWAEMTLTIYPSFLINLYSSWRFCFQSKSTTDTVHPAESISSCSPTVRCIAAWLALQTDKRHLSPKASRLSRWNVTLYKLYDWFILAITPWPQCTAPIPITLSAQLQSRMTAFGSNYRKALSQKKIIGKQAMALLM